MIRGSGNTGRINKDEPAAAPTVTGADNGLTLVGANVELGGANPLIQLTGIEQAGFLYTHTNTAGNIFTLDPANGLYSLGDLSGLLNATRLDVDDTNNTLFVLNNGNQMLKLEGATGTYNMGSAGFGNQTNFNMDDTAQRIEMASGGFTMLVLDMPTGIFQLGASAGGTANTTYLEVDDAAQQITTASAGSVNGFLIDLGGLNFQIGDFFNVGNGVRLSINDSSVRAQIRDTIGAGLDIDMTNRLYAIGDVDGNFNGTNILVDDTNQVIQLFSSLGVGINQLPTLSPFAVASLQNFANNAAAVVGGLGVGDFYRLSVAGTSAVMVVE